MKFISEFVVKSDDRYVEILIKYLSDDNSSQSGQFWLKISGSTMKSLTVYNKFRREERGVHLDGANRKNRIVIPVQLT